jgi:hypothetical protein
LIDPSTFHVRDLFIQLQQAPEEKKESLMAELCQAVDAYHDLNKEYTDAETENLYGMAIAQGAADKKIEKVLGRRVVLGDMVPEQRLLRGELEVSHPMLDDTQTMYVHGDVTNLMHVMKQIGNDEPPTIEFQARADFNPPTGYRDLDADALKLHPETHAYVQREALNFPMWEGEEAASAVNGAELIAEMKMYKLFHYAYPMIGDTEEAQNMFLEMYDVSPGEPTLEWALSYPTKEHTFFPEHPLWVRVFEDDEEVAPVVWPEYRPFFIQGLAEVSSSSRGDTATIRFLPHTKEHIAAEAHYHHVFSSLPVDKRFNSLSDDITSQAKSLSNADKQKAEAAWAALSPSQKEFAKRSWTFEASPLLTGQEYIDIEKEVLQREAVKAKILSQQDKSL